MDAMPARTILKLLRVFNRLVSGTQAQGRGCQNDIPYTGLGPKLTQPRFFLDAAAFFPPYSK